MGLPQLFASLFGLRMAFLHLRFHLKQVLLPLLLGALGDRLGAFDFLGASSYNVVKVLPARLGGGQGAFFGVASLRLGLGEGCAKTDLLGVGGPVG